MYNSLDAIIQMKVYKYDLDVKPYTLDLLQFESIFQGLIKKEKVGIHGEKGP